MDRVKKAISWLLVLVWMSLIFYLSHQTGDGSGSLSGGITEKVIEFLQIFRSKTIDIDFVHLLVRKGAHLFAYFVLGILLVNAFRVGGMVAGKYHSISFAICVFYAMTDELHQLLVPGRSGQVRDVLIDSVGALIGIFTYRIFLKVIGFTKEKRAKPMK